MATLSRTAAGTAHTLPSNSEKGPVRELPGSPAASGVLGHGLLTHAGQTDLGGRLHVELFTLIPLIALCIAEIITTYGDPRVGVGIHVGLLLAFLSLAAAMVNGQLQEFMLALTVAPLIRIVSVGMPLLAFPPPLWYFIDSIPLFAAAILIARQLGLSRRALGLQWPNLRSVPIELAALVSGVGLGYIEWLILRPAPLVSRNSVAWIIGASLILLISTGLLEELLFRGLIQRVAVGYLGPRLGILFTAVLFAVLHIGHRSVLDVVFVLGVGLYFSLVVRNTKSLFGVTMTHGTINIMLFIVLPLVLG